MYGLQKCSARCYYTDISQADKEEEAEEEGNGSSVDWLSVPPAENIPPPGRLFCRRQPPTPRAIQWHWLLLSRLAGRLQRRCVGDNDGGGDELFAEGLCGVL